jgi:hypothetical protein
MRYITESDAKDIADMIEAELYTDYSGRAMYGETCIGFVFDRYAETSELDLAFAAADVLGLEEARDAFTRSRSDSMGLDSIVYFPGLQLEKDEDDE